MTTVRDTPNKIPAKIVAQKDFETVNTQIAAENLNARYRDEQIYSGVFIATLHYAGIIKDFQNLQTLLRFITDAEPDLHNYGSGTLFTEILNEFYKTDFELFNNANLFGETDPKAEKDIASKVNTAISQVSNAMELIRQALELVEKMYGHVNNVLENANSDYLSTINRTEHLVTWAYRKGMKLNPEIYGIKRIGVDSVTGIDRTDLYGLLDMFDRLRQELETMREIPVYYRTGSGGGSDRVGVPVKVVTVNKNETINKIAERELGSADQSTMILEFNNLTYDDIQGDDWHGYQLKIPYVSPIDSERFENNFVLDSHAGIEALGKDLPNELEVDNGDLKILNYTNTFAQSLDNMILTPLGAIPEQSEYGSRIAQLNREMIPSVVSNSMSVEVGRALRTNPRVSEILNVKTEVDRGEASTKVKYQVRAINQLTEAKLQTYLDEL